MSSNALRFTTARACALAAIAGLTLAACASSGPTYSTYTPGPADGIAGHQVTCFGLLENRHSCEAQAQRICGGQPVSLLQGMAPRGQSVEGQPDSRVMVFQCGEPAAALTPAPVAGPAPVTSVTVRSDAASRLRAQDLSARVRAAAGE